MGHVKILNKRFGDFGGHSAYYGNFLQEINLAIEIESLSWH
jgi:hypothetical protein